MAIHTQLSLLEEAQLERPGLPDDVLVEDIAADLISELAERPPIDLKVVAGDRGIDRIRVSDLPVAGSLSREETGFVIRLRRGDRRARQRFTGFHEVSHTFHPGYALKTQRRCPAPSPGPRRSLDLEALCDISAAELILPGEFFAGDLHSSGLEISSLTDLADYYQASLEATGYRMVRFWPENACFVVLEPGVRKAERDDPSAEPKLRIRSRSLVSDWPFLPFNKSVDQNGVFARAQEEEIEEVTVLSDIGVRSNKRVRVSARPFPYRGEEGQIRRRVLALIREARPKPTRLAWAA